jgi:hypothetical protein
MFDCIVSNDYVKSTGSQKGNIIRYIKNHFVLNIDYITKNFYSLNPKGGRTKIDYYLTKNAFELRQIDLGNTYITHPILISIECATIGFIMDTFKDFNMKRQYHVNNYFIDLFLVDYKIAIECDESNHKSLIYQDKRRQLIIEKELNCTFYRYSPCEDNFKLSDVIYDIIKLTIKK